MGTTEQIVEFQREVIQRNAEALQRERERTAAAEDAAKRMRIAHRDAAIARLALRECVGGMQ